MQPLVTNGAWQPGATKRRNRGELQLQWGEWRVLRGRWMNMESAHSGWTDLCRAAKRLEHPRVGQL